MLWIIILVVLGLLFLLTEILLLPGISVGGVLSLVCYGCATYMAFDSYGALGGGIVIAVISVLSLAVTVVSLRAKTWQRLSLQQRIESAGNVAPQHDDVKVGDRGMTVSRLSPMGTVSLGGKTYEAKSADAYVDPKTEIEVVGFENFNVIVKKVIK